MVTPRAHWTSLGFTTYSGVAGDTRTGARPIESWVGLVVGVAGLAPLVGLGGLDCCIEELSK